MAWYNPFSWGASEKAVDNILDKDTGLLTQVGSWIGGMNYTDEEKAEAAASLREGVVEYAKETMGENTQRSLARRDIAVMWIKTQLGLVLLTAIAIPLDVIFGDALTEKGRFYLTAQYFSLTTSDVMIMGTGGIMVFFFGSYTLARFNQTRSK